MTGFTFSIIMAVYNSQDFLGEAIESVLNQDLDFNSHVQLILVDDGSSDGSYEICSNYQERFPENIVLLKKDNGGPGSARNLGLDHADGVYVNFLDSDDKLSSNALSEVLKFFKNHDTDLISIPIEYIGKKTGNHYMNYRFGETRIIDLNETFDCPQLSASTTFIRREAIGDLKFNENLLNGEDLLFVNQIMLNKMNYGVLNTATYYYRKHSSQNSLMDKAFTSSMYFTPKLRECFIRLIDYSLGVKGSVAGFIQYVIIQDLHGIIRFQDFNSFVKDKGEFFKSLRYILSYVDEDIILSQRKLDEHAKSFLIFIKNNEFHIEKTPNSLVLKSDDHIINNVHNNRIRIRKLGINGNHLYVEGYVSTCCFNKHLTVKLNEFEYKTEKNNPILSFAGIGWLFREEFHFEIPIENDLDIEIKLMYEDAILNNRIILLKNYESNDALEIELANNIIKVHKKSIKDKFKKVLDW